MTDLYSAEFPHGTVDGFDDGCRGSHCAFGPDSEWLTCREASIARASTYSLRNHPRGEKIPREILAPVTAKPSAPKVKPADTVKPISAEAASTFEVFALAPRCPSHVRYSRRCDDCIRARARFHAGDAAPEASIGDGKEIDTAPDDLPARITATDDTRDAPSSVETPSDDDRGIEQLTAAELNVASEDIGAAFDRAVTDLDPSTANPPRSPLGIAFDARDTLIERADNVIRAVLRELGKGPETDPVLAAMQARADVAELEQQLHTEQQAHQETQDLLEHATGKLRALQIRDSGRPALAVMAPPQETVRVHVAPDTGEVAIVVAGRA